MQPGELVGGRFEIERHVASGGMGEVYRAHDRVEGMTVALKILSRAIEEGPARFAREVEVLAALHHPGIVRYVAHGLLRGGVPFLAMEWLTGETLSERLTAGMLTIEGSMTLAAPIASALGAVHRRGLVHRDLKPSNIFLVNGAIDGAKLIDFGIVGLPGRGRALTVAEGLLGTPAYMAPEQIRRPEDADARADVFSLGCVLFKCLTGRRAFVGEDDLSILLKVLIEDPPRASALRAEVPAALDELLGKMLSKTAESRPKDGDAVAFALASQSEASSAPVDAEPTTSKALTEITTRERRVMCLLLTAETLVTSAATLSSGEHEARAQALAATVARHQGSLELLADRSALAVLTSAGTATDLASRAARCALSLNELLPDAPIAVVIGRAVLSSSLPVGELIDRAVALLGAALASGSTGEDTIRLDEVTAGLLGGRFDIGADDRGAFLRGEREALEATFTLLGKPTACVGRERELAFLEDTYARCVDETVASAVLVTGPAGAGKSRIAHEFLRRLRDEKGPLEVWVGRGDSVSAGSPFNLLGQAVRRTAGLLDGEPLEERRRKLSARVARHVQHDVERVTAFLGELCGTPFADEGDDRLRAARRERTVMGEQMRLAFEDFVQAECAAQPVVLVLEDLHWGDLPSIRFVDAALRALHEQPLLVLALARPEVHETLPRLWEGRRLVELALTPLTRRASERLAREVLEESVPPELLKTLVDRADGNAFYLEELIRAASHGKGMGLPETVLAMVQARLEGLDPEARRVLRAASIFGQSFWRGGVSALLGGAEVGGWLHALADQEVISLDAGGKFPGEVEYTFRHALVREAAYGMLTEGDRAVGHRLAGEWLERAGEVEPSVLAEHFDRGGEAARAAAWYRRAAERAASGRRPGGGVSSRRSSGDWSAKDSSSRPPSNSPRSPSNSPRSPSNAPSPDKRVGGGD